MIEQTRLCKFPAWIVVATIVYSAWMSRGIVEIWHTSPLDYYGWLPFVIWLIPAKNWTSSFTRAQALLVLCAIAITFLGAIASVNTIKLAGLALAISSLLKWSWRIPIWVLLAISWFPTLGWGLVHIYPSVSFSYLLLIRIAIALLAVTIMLIGGNDSYDK